MVWLVCTYVHLFALFCFFFRKYEIQNVFQSFLDKVYPECVPKIGDIKNGKAFFHEYQVRSCVFGFTGSIPAPPVDEREMKHSFPLYISFDACLT